MTDEEHRWAVGAVGLLLWDDPPDDGGCAGATAGTYRRGHRAASDASRPVGAHLVGAYRTARQRVRALDTGEVDWRQIA